MSESKSTVDDRIEHYFRALFQDGLKVKIRSVSEFYIYMYEVLWRYHSGVLPSEYASSIPSTYVRRILVTFVITDRGLLNANIVVKSNYDQLIEIGINAIETVQQQLLQAFGKRFSLGSFSTREALLIRSKKMPFSDMLETIWDEWILRPMKVVDECATVPNKSKNTVGIFRDIYYTAVCTNVNVCGSVITTLVNAYNKLGAKYDQYSLEYNDGSDTFILKVSSSVYTSRVYKPSNLVLPIGLLEHRKIIKDNLNKLFKEIFSFYKDTDTQIPDKTIQTMGNSIFSYSRENSKQYNAVNMDTSMADKLKEAIAKKIEEKKQEIKQPETREEVRMDKEQPKKSTKEDMILLMKIILSDHIHKFDEFNDSTTLVSSAIAGMDDALKIADTAYKYSIRCFKRVSRDKYHTLIFTIYDDANIIVNYSTKVFLHFAYMEKGIVFSIDGYGESFCSYKYSSDIVEFKDHLATDRFISNTIFNSRWCIANNILKKDYNKAISDISNCAVTKLMAKYHKKNTAYRFVTHTGIIIRDKFIIIVDVIFRNHHNDTGIIVVDNTGKVSALVI